MVEKPGSWSSGGGSRGGGAGGSWRGMGVGNQYLNCCSPDSLRQQLQVPTISLAHHLRELIRNSISYQRP